MTKWLSLVLALAFALGLATTQNGDAQTAPPTAASPPALPSISQFAADPSFRSAALSPNGRYVAGIKHEGTIDELVVIDLDTKQAQVVQRADEKAGVRLDWVDWKNDDLLILGTLNRMMMRFERGVSRRYDEDETWISRVIASPRTGGATVTMFKAQERRLAAKFAPTELVSRLPNDPENVLLSAYGPSGLTLWRANVKTGVVSRVEDAGWDTRDWIIDITGAAVLRSESLPRNSGYRWFRRAPGARQWTQFLEVKKADAARSADFAVFGPTRDPGKVFVAARRAGEDRASMHVFDTATGELGPAIGSHPVADVGYAMIDSTTQTLLASCALVHKMECSAADPVVARHLRAVDQFFGGVASVNVFRMSADQKTWLLAVEEPGSTPAYYVYKRDQAKIEPIVGTRASLAGVKLATTRVISYTGRDGTALWGYLTNGPEQGAPSKPLIVMPHGGPESRDEPGYDAWTQFLASRGYAVFQPNFRGGDGFGRAFAEAGYRQWGRRMQDDITDGLKHLVTSGLADPQRVCIFGWSYGGYAALAGGALTPDLYKCVIAGAGPSDLLRMLEFEREEAGRGSAAYAYWRNVIGDPTADKDALRAVSPRSLAAQFTAPVLLFHGVEDEIVPVEQSRIMKTALEQAGKKVKLVEFTEEGHGVRLEANTETFYKELEAFLKEHLPVERAR